MEPCKGIYSYLGRQQQFIYSSCSYSTLCCNVASMGLHCGYSACLTATIIRDREVDAMLIQEIADLEELDNLVTGSSHRQTKIGTILRVCHFGRDPMVKIQFNGFNGHVFLLFYTINGY